MKCCKRMLSVLLLCALLLGELPGVAAVSLPALPDPGLTLEEMEPAFDPQDPAGRVPEDADAPEHDPEEMVRVSIVLEDPPAIEKDFPLQTIGQNQAAIQYRRRLRADQADLTARIEREVLGGQKLDVQLNLTLVVNLISANVAYGQISRIEALPGVKEVAIEQVYQPLEGVAAPETHALPTTQTLGAEAVHDFYGFTGAGTRIAIIDSGVNPEHQSFLGEGLTYSLEQAAPDRDGDGEVSQEERQAYVDSLDLMLQEDIQRALAAQQLNVVPSCQDAELLYKTRKIPFAYNYCDKNLTTTNGSAGIHGSHVAGIAAANAYLPNGEGGFDRAVDTVGMAGVAPDAQILNMKVFGNGACTDSVCAAAIEDAVVLGADVLNLSLGSATVGFSCSDSAYGSILDELSEKGMVILGAIGNDGSWIRNNKKGRPNKLYADDVNLSTTTPPSSYAAFMGVGWADGEGYVGHFFQVPGENRYVFCNEIAAQGQNSASIGALAGDAIPYLVLPEDGDPALDRLEAAIRGRLVLLPGEGDVSSLAAQLEALGAAGAVFWASQPGANVHVSDYQGLLPVVTVTREDGAYLSAQAEPLEAEPACRLGSLVVDGGTAREPVRTTVNDSSAYGIPSSLMLQPEILALGTDVYSVDGNSNTGYTGLSGTSMASPEVAGMAALLYQSLQTPEARFGGQSFLERAQAQGEQGVNLGTLTAGLLMSTADPLYEEENRYDSLLRQGAGLANIQNAVLASSYLTLPDQPRGRVKAEVGASSENRFHYTFTIHNVSAEKKHYTLSTDLFTQGVETDAEGNKWLLETTSPLNGIVTYQVAGKPLTFTSTLEADVNRDRVTDERDAQAMLDYLSGQREGTDLDLDAGDLDQDRAYTSYDVFLLLRSLVSQELIVPANGSVTVEVEIQVAQDLTDYPKGAYLEGFTYVTPVHRKGTGEDVTHTIPILGFCGNWSDPSMFDRNSYVASRNGCDTVPYTQGPSATYNMNYLTYLDENGTRRYQYGNPYDASQYDPQWAARRSQDVIYNMSLALIRPAGALAFVAMQVGEDGSRTVKFVDGLRVHTSCAFPAPMTTGGWNLANTDLTVNYSLANMGLQDGDVVEIGAVAVPEYYEDGGVIDRTRLTALIEDGVLGEGAYLTQKIVIDDQKPTCTATAGNYRVTVNAQDDRCVAYVALYSTNGQYKYGEHVFTGEELQASATYTFQGVYVQSGTELALVVGDYAGNTTTYRLTYGNAFASSRARAMAYVRSYAGGSRKQDRGDWILFEPGTVGYSPNEMQDTVTLAHGEGGAALAGADAAGGYLWQALEDGCLYVSPLQAMNQRRLLCDLQAAGLGTVRDLAYHREDQMLYAVDGTDVLWRIDPMLGTVEKWQTVSGSGERPYAFYGLALDKGTVYATSFDRGTQQNSLVQWSLSEKGETAPTKILDLPGLPGPYVSLAWKEPGCLLASSARDLETPDNSNLLYCLWPGEDSCAVQKANVNNSKLYHALRGLVYLPTVSQDLPASPETAQLNLCHPPAMLRAGDGWTVSAALAPWDREFPGTLTWQSDRPEVVEVREDTGRLTALAPGRATITATYREGDLVLSESCRVTVEASPDIALSALFYESDGYAYWESFNTQSPNDRKVLSAPQARYLVGTMNREGDCLYVRDSAYGYRVDPVTFQREVARGVFEEVHLQGDAAPGRSQGYYADYGYLMVSARNGYVYLFGGDTYGAKGFETVSRYWQIDSAHISGTVAALAYKEYLPGYAQPKDPSTPDGADVYYALTESGDLYEMYLYEGPHAGEEYPWKDDRLHVSSTYLGKVAGVDLSGVGSMQSNATASMVYDQGTQYLALVSKIGTGPARVQVIDPQTHALVMTREFTGNVRQVGILYQNSPSELTEPEPTTPEPSEPAPTEPEPTMPEPSEPAPTEPVPTEPEPTEPASTDPEEDRNIPYASAAPTLPPAAEDRVTVDREQGTVTLRYPLPEAANGLLEFGWDPQVLALENLETDLLYHSRKAEEGTLRLAFADLQMVQGEVVLTCRILDPDQRLDTQLTVTTREKGEQLNLTQQETFPVVEERRPDRLEVATPPEKTTYLVGDSFESAGMTLTLFYNDGSQETVTTGWDLEYDFTQPGQREVKVRCQGLETSLTVTVEERKAIAMEVSTPPEKLEYVEGTELDQKGMKLTLIYNNGDREEITSGWEVDYDFTQTGIRTVTVTYQDLETSFEVTVVAKTLEYIAITEKPVKTFYLEGDPFDPTGLVVTAFYNNQTQEEVTGYTLSGYTSTPGEKTITVTYRDHTASFAVTVQAKSVTSIAMKTLPRKTVYFAGEALELEGASITVNYNNKTSQVLAVEDTMVSGYHPDQLGQQRLTVTYQGKTAYFTVTVQARVPTAITSSVYVVGDGYLSKIPLGTTAAQLLEGIHEKDYCQVYQNGKALESTARVGTGMEVRLMDGTRVVAKVTLVVTGDTNGDGQLTITDMLEIKSYLLKNGGLSEPARRAADTSGDRAVTITDFIQAKAHVLGKEKVTPRGWGAARTGAQMRERRNPWNP